ncbi:FAD-dependent oxidoreductase [Neoaquamicrobium sediminum]|uniref:FAD-dependent oxidoreductase n=1 Tax=Neoaquamicrobium sediminum TaxID=1849104 RepID=UPI004036526B
MRPDTVIVGGGIAGLVAANRALQLGLSAVVVEAGADENYLCNTRICGGVFHLAFQTVAQRPGKLRAAIEDRTFANADPEMVDMIVSNSARVVPWLTAEGVQFIRGGPEQYQFYTLAPPKWNRPGLDFRGRGGDVLLRRLIANFRHRGGAIIFNARATGLIVEGGRCAGVTVDNHPDIRARSVVLADGGFQANLNMVRKFVSTEPGQVKQRNAGTGLGYGAMMAEQAGAELVGLGAFYGHLLSRDALVNDRLWPYPVLDHLAAANIVVGKDGLRFCDEGLGGVSIANQAAKLAKPSEIFVVFDDMSWRGKPGTYHVAPPNPHLEREGGTVIRGDTIAALASAADIAPAALAQTVEMHNRSIRKDGLEVQAPARTTLRATPMPIVKPPFYAIPACPGISYTMGGIRTDRHAQVISRDGQPIPCLYAIGATTGGLEGGPQSGYLGGLSKSTIHGLVAAEQIARRRGSLNHHATQ